MQGVRNGTREDHKNLLRARALFQQALTATRTTRWRGLASPTRLLLSSYGTTSITRQDARQRRRSTCTELDDGWRRLIVLCMVTLAYD